MKSHCISIWLALISAACLAQPPQATSENDPNREKAGQLYRRVYRDRDYSAFLEAGQLPANISIPFLFQAAEAGPDPEAKHKAMEALKNLHGFKEDFQRTIATMADKEQDPGQEFQMLTAIGTLEAAEVIAPYLFDFRGVFYENIPVSIYNFNAAWALGRMRFGDAPTPKRPEKYGPDDRIAWQKWAIAHGMVPKEWDSRVGVPEWQYKMAAYRVRDESEFHQFRQAGGEQQPADPTDARRVWPPAAKGSHDSQSGPGRSDPFAILAGATGSVSPFSHAYLWATLAGLFASVAGWLLLRPKRSGSA